MSENRVKIKITDPTRIITLANGMSVFRAFLAFPIIYYLAKDEMVISVLFMLLAVFTDYFDGYFARRADEVTNLGKILDPVADKVVIFAVVLFIILDESRDFPEWFLWLYVARDLTISISSLYIMHHSSITLSANPIGKLSVGISALAILFYVLNIEELKFYFLIIATVLLIISWIQYMKDDLTHFKKNVFTQAKSKANSKEK
ncbi:MAG: CDP-alcohol phosphatidyltransferase family protein [Candidatus Marinimicrobia bacterium]|nr:CDP-alcohol phosphatidyltransferase family protein [Candidatus Neomarinimicrobiota bacterium]MBL7046138.1 CDP-alcohol phosphatidyltransferase family protein [Candidatus Neomarinimicrobiota bacterium]